MAQPDKSASVIRGALQRYGLTVMRRFPTRPASFAVPAGRVTHELVSHWIGDGWPGRVSEVLRRVGTPWPRKHVVVGRRFSPGAVALLDKAAANWVEEDGRVRIRTDTGLIVERDVSPPATMRPTAPFRWSPARADVAEVLLATGSVPPVREVAESSGWSREQVSEALRQFDRLNWTEKRGAKRGRTSERVVAAPEPLRESWAEHVVSSPRERLLAHGVVRDPLSFLERELAPRLRRLGRWTVSGWVGSALIAPRVTSIPVLQVYVEATTFQTRLRPALSELGLREVDSGQRVEFWEARPAAFCRTLERRGIPVVHASRLYADLLALGDRGRDAAREVLEVLIGT
jgi:hypothetical protein